MHYVAAHTRPRRNQMGSGSSERADRALEAKEFKVSRCPRQARLPYDPRLYSLWKMLPLFVLPMIGICVSKGEFGMYDCVCQSSFVPCLSSEPGYTHYTREWRWIGLSQECSSTRGRWSRQELRRSLIVLGNIAAATHRASSSLPVEHIGINQGSGRSQHKSLVHHRQRSKDDHKQCDLQSKQHSRSAARSVLGSCRLRPSSKLCTRRH